MDLNFAPLYDAMQASTTRMDNLINALIDGEEIDRDTIISELLRLQSLNLDIRKNFIDGYCDDERIKQSLISNIEAHEMSVSAELDRRFKR